MINGVMFQAFHWYLPPDGNHWNWLKDEIPVLAQKGVTSVWLPPFSKAWGGMNANGNQTSVGYDVYDLWDLGRYKAHSNDERTKYGHYDELIALIQKCKREKMQVYADLVFNHKMGAKNAQKVRVQKVDSNNYNHALSDWIDKHLHCNFDFENRMKAQANGNTPTDSQFRWRFDHFDAYISKDDGVFRIKAKDFQCQPNYHYGNHPYLMGLDLDTSHPDVVEELCRFGEWLVNEIGIDGFRIDAIKHIRQSFFPEFLERMRKSKTELFAVGEFWEDHDLYKLTDFINNTGRSLSLFDFRLRENFWHAANSGANYPLPDIFNDTLVASDPVKAVTFVTNHDLQPFRQGKDFRLIEHDWFKPLAYALILLRPQGYPCVFFGDYFDSNLYKTGLKPRHKWMIDNFLEARKVAVGGSTVDYFDHPNCIGWVSSGLNNGKSMAVVMSNGGDGWKKMSTNKPDISYRDITKHYADIVTTNARGEATFKCRGGKVSVWLEE